jgi:hypothetical protein
MSAKLTGLVWELELPHHKQSVMLALADNAHDDGSNCYPGVDYLSWKTGYDRRTVQRILRDLETDGLIIPVTNSSGGRGRELEYRIDVTAGTRKRPWHEVREELRRQKREKQAGKRAADCPPLSDPKGGNSPTFTEEEKGGETPTFGEPKGRRIEQQRAASDALKGGNSHTPLSITEPSTEPNTNHTHRRASADAPLRPAAVCVCDTKHGSKICDAERIRIASNMPGIRAPERYAMTVEARRGTYDLAFLKRQRELQKLIKPSTEPERDTSACPDCGGLGFWYPAGNTPEGMKQGTAKCLHPRLEEGLRSLEEQYEQAREVLSGELRLG